MPPGASVTKGASGYCQLSFNGNRTATLFGSCDGSSGGDADNCQSATRVNNIIGHGCTVTTGDALARPAYRCRQLWHLQIQARERICEPFDTILLLMVTLAPVATPVYSAGSPSADLQTWLTATSAWHAAIPCSSSYTPAECARHRFPGNFSISMVAVIRHLEARDEYLLFVVPRF